MSDEIINRVASSGLITIDLEEFYPEGERILLDIKSLLWEGIALRENDLRDFICKTNWSEYNGKYVAIYCSADAIIPTWAYMLLSAALSPFVKDCIYGTLDDLENKLFYKSLQNINPKDYREARVVIKGCSKKTVPISAYTELTTKLQPYVKSIMFGEPCSTVPIFKKPKEPIKE